MNSANTLGRAYKRFDRPLSVGVKLSTASGKLSMMPSAPTLPPAHSNNLWYHQNESSSVVIFVHGIFSDSRTCWLTTNADPEVYWPQLVAEDERLQGPSVFLGGFYTAVDSGKYDIADCAKELLAGLTIPDNRLRKTPLEHKRLVFVCHSTGGIIVRYLLANHAGLFSDKEVGLVLIASPSYGSKLADKLGGLASFYDNQLGRHLQWGNDLLRDLDTRFKILLDEQRISRLVGVEASENHFIFHRKYLPDKLLVVDEESAGRYFAVRTLADTDHFTTVKPTGLNHPAHRLLVQFWLRHYGPPFSPELKRTLESSKTYMRAKNLPYFTPALLLTLLHANGFAAAVMNSVRAGSAAELRERYIYYLDRELPDSDPGNFVEFDWFDRPDVRLAQELAVKEHASTVNERMMIKAILLSASKSAEDLKTYFGSDFEKVLTEVEHRRVGIPRTPGSLYRPPPTPER